MILNSESIFRFRGEKLRPKPIRTWDSIDITNALGVGTKPIYSCKRRLRMFISWSEENACLPQIYTKTGGVDVVASSLVAIMRQSA